jgi:hypothetical protein
MFVLLRVKQTVGDAMDEKAVELMSKPEQKKEWVSEFVTREKK